METSNFLIASYNKLLQEGIEKYGDLGIGTLMIRLQFLSTVLKIEQDIDVNNLKKTLIKDIINHYSYENIPESSLTKFIQIYDNQYQDTIYCFNEDEFNRRYSNKIMSISKNIITINLHTYDKYCKDGQWYIYVIDENNNIIIYNDPMPVTELVLNRNQNHSGNIVVHPMLVYNKGLKVKAAGEMTFIKENGELKGVIANTKSGHFSPPPSTSTIISRIISRNLDIDPNKIIVIPVRKKTL